MNETFIFLTEAVCFLAVIAACIVLVVMTHGGTVLLYFAGVIQQARKASPLAHAPRPRTKGGAQSKAGRKKK